MARTVGSDGEKTERAALDAAEKLFAARGYAATSVREIAHAVGVQPGALYNYFPTKQAILTALLRTHMEELLEAADAALRPQPDAAARLDAFTRFHVRHHLPRADAVFISYMELRSLEPENFKEINALRGRYEGLLAEILSRGVEEGVFVIADIGVATKGLIAMLAGVHTWFREDGRLSAPEIEAIYCDLVARCVGMDRDAQTRARAAAGGGR